MATLKLPKKPPGTGRRTSRPPVRGVNSGLRPRPTLAEKEARRPPRSGGENNNSNNTHGGGPGRADDTRRKPPRERERAAGGHPAADPPRPRTRRPEDARTRAPAPAAPADAGANTAFSPRPRTPTPPAAPAAPARPRPTASRSPIRAEDRPAASPRPQAPRPPAAARPAPRPAQAELRLSKRMSELGIASRREADEWIAKGWVRVDGQVVSELGSRVRPDQLITVDTPAKFHQARKVTVLLNKPVGYVSGQAEDGHEPAWVLIKPENQWRQDASGIRFRREHTRGLAPAGRLDLDSVGLLVMTQDGRVAKQLIGEDSDIDKEYLVQVAPSQPGQLLSDAGLARLNHGLTLDGVALKPAQVAWVEKDRVLRFILREGRKRQIRRMCEAVGLQVVSLQRVRIGRVALGELPPGQWRYLRLDEGFDN